jgi:hypothetical protein
MRIHLTGNETHNPPAETKQLRQRRRPMAYGHAERNLALIRQLEAETRELLDSIPQLDPEQPAWPGTLTLESGTGANTES